MIARVVSAAGLVALASIAMLGPAAARHRHHVRIVERVPRQFVFQSPASADTTVFAGKVAGYLSPGILGASTADPYERPGNGYYVGGGRGPGYVYEGE